LTRFDKVSAEESQTAQAGASFLSAVPKDALKGRRVLIVVENLPLPFDRRVWLEARTLAAAGAVVSVICPSGKGYDTPYEQLEGVHIHRHPLIEASSTAGYLKEYISALIAETRLAWRIFFGAGFDVIHACNPPDLIFLVALPFKLLGRKFIFDHHDINPELYEAKFNKRGLFWRLLVMMERLTFLAADVSIATNESYRRIAIQRGKMKPEKVFVVRSGPDVGHLKMTAPNPALKNGRRFLVGYVGVMGEQEGIDLLLEAIAHIVRGLGRQDMQVCLIGGGPSLPALKALCSTMGLDDYVTFTGRAPDDLMFEMLSTADVCVNPDKVNPMNDLSTMNKIMEYMAFEKPIVQFDVVEGRVSAQGASLYAAKNDPLDFAAKIVELLDDPERRAEMGRQGRRRLLRDLSWQTQISSLIAAYQTALRT